MEILESVKRAASVSVAAFATSERSPEPIVSARKTHYAEG